MREAFLQAIIDDPDDDTPRLIFADWLDENGEPERAEFIRCSATSVAGCSSDRRRSLPRRVGVETQLERWFTRAFE
jgi:uncharacterized protein (TIGR02996 family)